MITRYELLIVDNTSLSIQPAAEQPPKSSRRYAKYQALMDRLMAFPPDHWVEINGFNGLRQSHNVRRALLSRAKTQGQAVEITVRRVHDQYTMHFMHK